MYDLHRLNPDAFAWLSLSLLKRQVSPAVRMVSAAGTDGGRDAVLLGPCTTGRYPWNGRWVFQFKHYRGQPAKDRARVLADLAKEVPATHARPGGGFDHYVMVTSVPFTGAPQRGLFDRVAALQRNLESTLQITVDLWDGLEVQALVIGYPDLAAQFFGPSRPGAPAAADRWPIELGVLAAPSATRLADDDIAASLRGLVGNDPRVLAPGSTSPLWQLYMRSDNVGAAAQLHAVERQLNRRRPRLATDPQFASDASWVSLTLAAVDARLGRPQAAITRARSVLRRAPHSPDLAAWTWNVVSIAYGKLDADTSYRRATDQAVAAARAADNAWLQATVMMRSLHKRSWSAAESGSGLDNAQFEDELQAATGDWAVITASVREHLHAQVDAYVALHYTWQDAKWDTASRAVRSAESRFVELGDTSELARIRSEQGRLHLLSGSYDEAITLLQQSVRQRLLQGELPRARYDLFWLGQSCARAGRDLEAEVCWYVALAIHEQLYAGRKNDQSIVQLVHRELTSSQHQLPLIASAGRVDRDFLGGLVAGVTGLTASEVFSLVDVAHIRASIVQPT